MAIMLYTVPLGLYASLMMEVIMMGDNDGGTGALMTVEIKPGLPDR